MSDPFDCLDESARSKLRERAQPTWTAPMLATLTDRRFDDPDWLYERKLDGERCLVFRSGSSVRLMSRNRKELDDTYPELVDAVAGESADDFIADGEIVAFRTQGGRRVTSFARLQQRMKIRDADEARRSPVAVRLYLFDLLHLAGRDCTKLPLRDRKRVLRRALDFEDPLRFTTHRNEHGTDWLEDACRKGWEGLIAKRADSTYVHSRSKDWLKFKCDNRQELVIGGWTEPSGERVGLGAIIVGFHDDGELVCAGKVGTGFDDEMLEDLAKRLRSRERKSSPFDRGREPSGDVHWARPDLVAEIGFTEWTDDDHLRHPRFIGLRRDKDPKDVVKESPD